MTNFALKMGVQHALENSGNVEKDMKNKRLPEISLSAQVQIYINVQGPLPKLQPKLEGMAESLGVSDKVSFIGFRNDVRSILDHIDVLVLPSRCEGFGYALAEAMAVGKPVVATDVSSIPEIVADGRSGLLVPPCDSRALGEAIVKVLSGPECAQRMGEEGHRIVRKRFSIDRMLDELKMLFQEVYCTYRQKRFVR